MPSSKSVTPSIPPGHATEALDIGTVEEIAALAKLTPVTLPNDTLVASLRESHPKEPRWRSFRNNPDYLFVTNWLFQFRGFIKLASDHFDCDLFEIELFELVQPPPVDEMSLLSNKVKLALISKVHGKKVSSLAMFETLFRVYFGSETALSGPSQEDEESGENIQGVYPAFDDLFIDEKYNILSILISEISTYPDFREYIDKNKISPDNLRPLSAAKLVTRERHRGEEYLSLFDGTALYKRTTTASDLIIPKKRKLSPKHPELHFSEETFDIVSVTYQLIYKDIYGLNSFIKELLKNKRLKTNIALLGVINKSDYISNVYAYEIRKRKIISGRKKEFEMARLLATRKRSSRIEAKEKQKQQEEEEKKAQELEDLMLATSRRSQRARSLRTNTRNQQHALMDYTAGLSREERLNLRKEKVEDVEARASSETATPPYTNNPNISEGNSPKTSASAEPEVIDIEDDNSHSGSSESEILESGDDISPYGSAEPEIIEIEDDNSRSDSAAHSSVTSPIQTPK